MTQALDLPMKSCRVSIIIKALNEENRIVAAVQIHSLTTSIALASVCTSLTAIWKCCRAFCRRLWILRRPIQTSRG